MSIIIFDKSIVLRKLSNLFFRTRGILYSIKSNLHYSCSDINTPILILFFQWLHRFLFHHSYVTGFGSWSLCTLWILLTLWLFTLQQCLFWNKFNCNHGKLYQLIFTLWKQNTFFESATNYDRDMGRYKQKITFNINTPGE